MRSSIYFAILGTLLASTVAFRSAGSPDDVVFRDIGVKVEKIGKAISTDNEILISIIVELPNITSIGDEQEAFSIELVRKKVEKCSLSKMYKSVWEGNNFYYRERASKFLNSRLALLKPFITPLNETFQETTGRRKRGLLSFLGNLGLTLFMGGVTEGQIYRLKGHVDRNRKDIDSLRHGILTQQAEIENLSEHVVGFMRKLTREFQEVIDVSNSCGIFLNQWGARQRLQFFDWTREVDDTLWSAIKGENSLLLTPRMLSLNKLETIVRRSRALQGTMFQDNPTYLYSLAKVSLLEIEKNLKYAHLVLQAPSVTAEDTVDIFKVEQVGAHLGGDNCLFHHLPNFLYKKIGQQEFYPINLDRCNKHNSMYVCPFEDFSNETSCIQEKYNSCSLKRLKCPHNYQFVMSQIGILLRNNVEGKTFSADLNGLYSSVKLSNYGTAYLYWKDLSSIQISNKKISSPNMEHIELKMANLSPETDSLLHYLDENNVTNVFKSICDKYNKSLAEIIDPAFDNWFSEKKDQKSSNWIITIILIFVFTFLPAILLWLGYLQYRLYALHKSNPNIHEYDDSHISLINLATPRRASF